MPYYGLADAGNRHVRFDERGWETERCRMAQATAPILDSTEAAVPACPLPSGKSFVFDCANDRREYGAASASGDRL
jgi:hypothetical protein